MGIIEADHYRKTRKKLMEDPIIQAMAQETREVWSEDRNQLAHQGGTPTHEFMARATDEYHKRGGEVPSHLGGPAEAIIMILQDDDAESRARSAEGV